MPDIYRYFPPVISDLIKSRLEALAIAAIAIFHIIFISIGLQGWPCPIKAGLGIPCPGCYLGTAISLLLKGKIYQSMSVHAFAPIILIAVLLITLGGILPDSLRTKYIRILSILERRTGISIILMFFFSTLLESPTVLVGFRIRSYLIFPMDIFFNWTVDNYFF